MTREQAAAVLAYLTEAFRAEVSDVEAAIWCSELADLDAALAEAAARRIVRDSEYFPPIARFREAYRAETRARAARQPALPAQPVERVDRDNFLRGLAAARATLRGRRSG